MNKNSEGIGALLLGHLKSFFTKNLALKIVSLAFALLIWSYVMLDTNPERTKIVTDIPVSFSGESDLHERGLAIRGDPAQILKSVTARVSTELTNYVGLDASDISASVSLRTVSKADTYRLKINAVTQQGTVLSISPSEIVVEVDQLVTRMLPIEVEYSGALPEGYWRGEPVLGSQTVYVSGPRDDVSTVSKAICTIDLNGRTSNCNESMLLRYVDESGREVDSALFLDQMPSVVVRMEVLRMATLRLNTQDAVLGTDALPANYEVYNIVTTPPAVRVAGSKAVIEALESVDLESMDVSGSTVSVQSDVAVIAPEGTVLLDEPTVTVYVDIREKIEESLFSGLAIEVRGLERGYTAELAVPTADITILGRVSLMRLLERNEVGLYVDVTGLQPGEHTLDIGVSLPTTDMQTELIWELATPKVQLTISE